MVYICGKMSSETNTEHQNCADSPTFRQHRTETSLPGGETAEKDSRGPCGEKLKSA